jgi:hemolysin activation/secretion protein
LRRFILPGAIGALIFAALPVLAQQTPFIIDRSRADRTPAPAPAPPPAVAAPAPENANLSVRPFTLAGVRIEGTSLAPGLLGAATRGFIGKAVGTTADLTAIAQAVSDAYGKSGDIALYTINIPVQDFAGGMILLQITEGYIEHVELRGDTGGDVTRVIAMADKLTKERPLRRSTLQRYLSLIRDLPGLTIDAQMLRGQAAGAVRLVLTLTQKRFSPALTLTTGGNTLLGRTQIQADFSLYNLFRQGEETKFSFGTSTIFSRYQYYGVSHSEALDDEGTRAALAYGYLRTDVGGLALSGQAQTLQLALSHPLIRSFEENLNLSVSLDGLDASNALLGTLISNEQVRALRGSAGYSLVDERSALTLSASLAQGLDIADARSLFGSPDFRKLVVQGGYNRLLGEDWVARLKATGQLSGGPLPISELFALGGADYGRAFLSASALGDQALAGSLEVGYLPKGLPSILNGLEIFAFGDQGTTWLRRRGLLASTQVDLASVGAGIRLSLGRETRLELAAANAISANAPGTRAGSWLLLLGISSRF